MSVTEAPLSSIVPEAKNGFCPVFRLPPLEYRCAIDAAMTFVQGRGGVLVRCDAPELLGEVRQRFLDRRPAAGAGLWVEPAQDTWRNALPEIVNGLSAAAPLAIVMSLPLARWLPERRAWGIRPLGLQLRGVARLRRSLAAMGCKFVAQFGFHSPTAVAFSTASQLAARMGRLAWSDRLHFAARLHYTTTGALAGCSTVALLIVRKEVAQWS